MEMGIMLEGTKWHAKKWEKGKVLENGEKRPVSGLGAQDENELYYEKAGSYTGG